MRQLDLLSALQSRSEGIDTEFKSAPGGMPGSFRESYAAMANTHEKCLNANRNPLVFE